MRLSTSKSESTLIRRSRRGNSQHPFQDRNFIYHFLESTTVASYLSLPCHRALLEPVEWSRSSLTRKHMSHRSGVVTRHSNHTLRYARGTRSTISESGPSAGGDVLPCRSPKAFVSSDCASIWVHPPWSRSLPRTMYRSTYVSGTVCWVVSIVILS